MVTTKLPHGLISIEDITHKRETPHYPFTNTETFDPRVPFSPFRPHPTHSFLSFQNLLSPHIPFIHQKEICQKFLLQVNLLIHPCLLTPRNHYYMVVHQFLLDTTHLLGLFADGPSPWRRWPIPRTAPGPHRPILRHR